MTDRLEQMLERQREFQRRVNGYDVGEQTNEQRIANFRESVLALIAELYEALNEMGWKSWATSRHFNRDAVQSELIDAWHFMLNLFLHAGMDADVVADRYAAKQVVNNRRQDEGYDGVTGKCPRCRRSYDDWPADAFGETRCWPLVPGLATLEEPDGDTRLYGYCVDAGRFSVERP